MASRKRIANLRPQSFGQDTLNAQRRIERDKRIFKIFTEEKLELKHLATRFNMSRRTIEDIVNRQRKRNG